MSEVLLCMEREILKAGSFSSECTGMATDPPDNGGVEFIVHGPCLGPYGGPRGVGDFL